MIQPQELRIGNLLNHSELGIVEIISVGKDYIHCVYNGETFYETFRRFTIIPLTEEWLSKARFEKATPTSETPIQNDNNTIFVLRDEDIKEYNIYISFGADTMICIGNYGGIRYIESVHQLQNIHFILTGEELKFEDIS